MNANRPEDTPGITLAGLELGFKVALDLADMASSTFTIGQLAAAAGVPTSTLRYYERSGLLRPSARSASNYRLYSNEDLEKLRFIRAAQASGFRLEDVTKLLRPASCGKVQGLIGERLDEVGQRMKELRRVQHMADEILRNQLALAAPPFRPLRQVALQLGASHSDTLVGNPIRCQRWQHRQILLSTRTQRTTNSAC